MNFSRDSKLQYFLAIIFKTASKFEKQKQNHIGQVFSQAYHTLFVWWTGFISDQIRLFKGMHRALKTE